MKPSCVILVTLVSFVLCHEDNVDSSDEKDVDAKKKSCQYECFHYYQCEDGRVITDGSGLIDARKNSPPPEEDVPLDTARSGTKNCKWPYVCCKPPGSDEDHYHHQCGIRRPYGVDRRIQSTGQNGDTEFGEFPWQGALLLNSKGQTVFKCACVLIHKLWALTVAHCVEQYRRVSPAPVFARFGVWDTRKDREFLPAQTAQISSITIHPKYNNDSLVNDIALIRFATPIKYAQNVDTICLPRRNETPTSTNCIVTGWGKDAYDGGKFSRVLRKVSVPVISHAECQNKLRKTRLGEFYQLHPNFICAGGNKGQDACKGDGGGPLVCYRKDGRYSLAGIVSWGIDCGQANVPGIYVKVVNFLPWITEVTGLQLKAFEPEADDDDD